MPGPECVVPVAVFVEILAVRRLRNDLTWTSSTVAVGHSELSAVESGWELVWIAHVTPSRSTAVMMMMVFMQKTSRCWFG